VAASVRTRSARVVKSKRASEIQATKLDELRYHLEHLNAVSKSARRGLTLSSRLGATRAHRAWRSEVRARMKSPFHNLGTGGQGTLTREELHALKRENAALKRENTLLRAASRTDPLTGLANRRAFDERLRSEIARAGRHGQPLSVLVVDIDEFKRINDTWGHDKGDEVLVWVARFLQSQLRLTDIACRIGGDEFVVILPATARDGAEALVARLRETLGGLRGTSEHPVNMSFGLAALGPGCATSEALVAAADRAMYAAKGRGRHGRLRPRSA
jgi:diguanylate cyclase (GGDEF)-like protein